MERLFRERGFKVTPQRECIFEVLSEAQSHPSAEAVFAEARIRMPTISLKTVYQTLNDLVEMGEIQQFDLGTGASRFDPNVDVHHHLVCLNCGKVRDLYADYSRYEIPPEASQGFTVGSAEVVFRGLCEPCRNAAATVDQPPIHPPASKEPRYARPQGHQDS
jgi:Fe2+ or Zn2+ uptake regulation protein